MHFLRPASYLAVMPPYLPQPVFLNYLSGLCEIAGGLGILIPRLRRLAGYGLIALLVAVFPANIHMAVNGVQPPGWHLPTWALWLRLPFQPLLIAWVAFVMKPEAPSPGPSGSVSQ